MPGRLPGDTVAGDELTQVLYKQLEALMEGAGNALESGDEATAKAISRALQDIASAIDSRTTFTRNIIFSRAAHQTIPRRRN